MTGSTEERTTALRKLVEKAAAQQRVLQEDVALLTNEKLRILVDKDLNTTSVLQRTTYDELVAAGITRGAAIVLKMLFPGPTEGSYGSVTVHLTRGALEKLGKAAGVQFDEYQVELLARGKLSVDRLAWMLEDRNIKLLEYCVTTSDAAPSAEHPKDGRMATA